MKKSLLSLILSIAFLSLFANNIQISFAATGVATTLENITVENLSKGTSLTLNGSDILILTSPTGIEDLAIDKDIKIIPNPINNEGEIQFVALKSGITNISIIDASGKIIALQSDNLQNGSYSYLLSGLPTGLYFVNIIGQGYSYNTSIASVGTTSKTVILKQKNVNTEPISKLKSLKSLVTMDYSTGDNLKFTGTSGTLTAVITDIPTVSKTISFPFVTSQISYYDKFDSLSKKWITQLYSFDENGCNMVNENIAINNSILTLSTSINSKANLPKKYNGGEIGDTTFMLYGFYEVRMKPKIAFGTVGSFFLMNKWVATNWEHQEIDIEFTGNKMTSMQMTTHDYQDGGTVHKYSTTIKELNFDISEAFHTYGILWTEDSVCWYVDGNLFHIEKLYVPKVPLQIRMNHWAGNMSLSYMIDWLGEIQDTKLPSAVEYDWIKYQSLSTYFGK